MNPEHCDEKKPEPLRPLSNGRTRPSEVIEQIHLLLSLSPAQCEQIMARRERSGGFTIKEEALVYLMRHLRTQNRKREADAVARSLLARSAGIIARSVKRAFPTGTAVQQEQCIEEVQFRMWEAILSNEPKDEFWEIGFWFCLKRRTIGCLAQFRKISYYEVHPVINQQDDEEATNAIELFADPAGASMHSHVELQDAMNRLPAGHRQAMHLFYVEGWSQKQIAVTFGVADRTVRNWLTSATTTLRQYYGVGAHTT